MDLARGGQKGLFHRTEMNKKIYRIGNCSKNSAALSDLDLTTFNINPMGGFPRYGILRDDFIIIKGSLSGPVRGVVTLRRCLMPSSNRNATESISLKFIDTSSKFGHGSTKDSIEQEP